MKNKYEALKEYIKELKSVIIAFSCGVDSTLLLKAALDALGQDIIAVTARSLSYPQRELNESIAFTKENNIKHIIIDAEELDIEGFSKNPPNRCYLCKNELFTKILEVAKEYNITHILEGSNADDTGDYRPGLQAVLEHGILSPLRRLNMTKDEIREISKTLGLKTWNKQAFACLASRFPYGEEITPQKLHMVDQAEQFLMNLGFTHIRVRHHGNLARIETTPDRIAQMAEQTCREKIHSKFKEIGFTYISLDLKGYQSGSMNATLYLN